MSRVGMFFLCFFLGFLGIHRFVAGKVGTGILWLLTGGLVGIGWFVDLILCLTGHFSKKQTEATNASVISADK